MKALRGLFVVLALLRCAVVSAQNETGNSVYEQVAAISERYKNAKGVKSFEAQDGFKLQTVKLMLRKEFGREFVDNIKTFVVVFYKDAKADVVEKIVADIEQIAATLQSVNIDSQLKPGGKAQGYVRLSENGEVLTDLLVVTEKPSPKFVYFGGRFKPENIQYNPK